MIKEYNWYITTNRFSEIVEQLDGTIREYGASLSQNNQGDFELREKARLLCQEHLVKSGMRTEDNAFINIDLEFFDDGELNEEKLNRFLKDIVKNHTYQKILWEYMGTTGLMTNISKDKMKFDRFNYENYLPAELKKKEIQKNKNSLTRNFNKLKDDSGFNWKMSYDPNYNVNKKDWFTCYDENGFWTYYKKNTETHTENVKANTKDVSIKVIKTDKGCMIYDAGDILLNPVISWYLTSFNEVYGGEESNTLRIIDKIREQMNELGVDKITEISVPSSAEKSVEEYKKIFGNLIDKKIKIVDSSIGKQIYNNNVENCKTRIIQEESNTLQHKINSILNARPDASMQNITEALESGKIEVYLNAFNEEDALKVKISNEEYSLIIDLTNEIDTIEKKNNFINNCLKISYNWNDYSSCGKSKNEIYRLMYSYYKENKNSDFSYETLLKDIINKQNYDANINPERLSNKDFFIEELKKYIDKLPSENKEYAVEYVNSIPGQKPEVSCNVFSNIKNAIENYVAIRSSTGISIKELFDYSIKSAKGCLPRASIQPPTIGYVTPNMQGSAPKDLVGSKVVYFESSVESLCADMEKISLPKKEVYVSELEKEYDEINKEKPVVIIGKKTDKNNEKMIYDFGEEIINLDVLVILKSIINKTETSETEFVHISKNEYEEQLIEIAKKCDSAEQFYHSIKNKLNIEFDLSVPENRELFTSINPAVSSEALLEMTSEIEEKIHNINFKDNYKNDSVSNVNVIFRQLSFDEIINDNRLPSEVKVMNTKHNSFSGIENVTVFKERKYSLNKSSNNDVKYVLSEDELDKLSNLKKEEFNEVKLIIDSMPKTSVNEMLGYLNNDWSLITPLLVKEYLWRKNNSRPIENLISEVRAISTNEIYKKDVVYDNEYFRSYGINIDNLSPVLKQYINKKTGKEIFENVDSVNFDLDFNNRNVSKLNVSKSNNSYSEINSINENRWNFINPMNSGRRMNSNNSYELYDSPNYGLNSTQNVSFGSNNVLPIKVPSSNAQHVSVNVPFTLDSSLFDRKSNDAFFSNESFMNSINGINPQSNMSSSSRFNGKLFNTENGTELNLFNERNVNSISSLNNISSSSINVNHSSSYNNMDQMNSNYSSKKSVNNISFESKGVTQEEQRIARMNANYEHDKNILAKKDPVFAKNEFWDVGHAEGSNEMTERDLDKIAQRKSNEML